MTTTNPHQKKPQKSSHPSDTEIVNLELIQKQVEKRLVNPEQSHYCSCNICLVNYQLKQRGKAFLRQTSSNLKIQASKMQEFLHLITAVSAKNYMKLDIPQICFFYKGQPRKLFRSNNTGVHQIQLTPTVKKNLISVFLENKRTTTNNAHHNNNNNTNKQGDSAGKDSNNESMVSFFTGERNDTHIKNFASVIPSFKHGQKIATKKPQTYIFHNNPNYSQDPNFSYSRQQSQQICILKTKDKGFQLLNQKQLRQTLKSLLHLQPVQFIQTYIKPNQKQDQIYQANYKKSQNPQTNNPLMFNRSLIQIKTEINLLNKFSKDYIPLQTLQNYQNILKDIPSQYCLYQTYKMVHYMELMKDITVEKLGTFWIRNQSEQLCFFGLVEFQWRENQKFNVDIGEIQELKEIMRSELSDFQQELMSAWEHMKNRKLKPMEKRDVDVQKQMQYQRIRRQSLHRLAKQKQLQNSIRKPRKKSIAQKSSRSIKSNQSSIVSPVLL